MQNRRQPSESLCRVVMRKRERDLVEVVEVEVCLPQRHLGPGDQ